jgi:hypothetical protein
MRRFGLFLQPPCGCAFGSPHHHGREQPVSDSTTSGQAARRFRERLYYRGGDTVSLQVI